MEGVKSSPNNPGRQAILLSSLTLQPLPPSFPTPFSTLTFPSLLLFLSFPFCIFPDGATHPPPRAVPADRRGITAV